MDQLQDTTDYAEAAAFAQASIDANNIRQQLPTITTNDGSLRPGQTIVVDLPEIGLPSQTVFIQGVAATVQESDDKVTVTYELTLAAGTKRQPTPADLWRQVIAGRSA
jgi:hypothetical protein